MTTEAVLHVISDRQRHRLPLFDAMLECANAGADVLQIREKKAPAKETYEFCNDLMAACTNGGSHPSFIINDRLDIAVALGAHGVHLAQKSLPVPIATSVRDKFNWHGSIGCSVHSFEEAVEAAKLGADYVTFGHVYASESHRGQPPRGVHELARIVEALEIPVIAIGGIDRSNILHVLSTGCSGIAVIGAVLDQDHPYGATISLKEQIVASSIRPKVAFQSLKGVVE